METKICKICKQEKDISHFYFRKDTGKYREQCEPCRKQQNKEYRMKNQDKIKARSKENYAKNAEQQKLKHKEYYKLNAEKIKIRTMEYYNKNKEKRKEYNRQYRKFLRNNRPMYKIIRNLRARTHQVFQNKMWKKNTHFSEYIGLNNFDELQAHIENLFQPGMSWNNYGEWVLDHIIPMSLAKNEKDAIWLCYYLNIRPCWASENKSKRDRTDFIIQLNVKT